MKRCRWIAIVAFTLLACAHDAFAQDISLVTVVRPLHADGPVEEATMRLVAELKASGFHVRVTDSAPGSDGRALVENTDPDAIPSFATIAILATDRGTVADVWVADHVTHKTLVRRVDVSDPTVPNAASDLAVRSVELLHASLLEVDTGQKEVPPDVARWIARRRLEATPAPAAPTSPKTNTAPPRPTEEAEPDTETASSAEPKPQKEFDSASVELGFGAFCSAGGFGVAPAPVLRLDIGVARGLAVRASFAPAVAPTYLGVVALYQQQGTLDLVYTYRDLPVAPRFAIGGGLYHVHVDGTAAPGFGEQHDVFAGFVSAAAGLEIRVGRSVAVVAEVDAMFVQSDIAVVIGGTEAGNLGRAVFLGLVGLEVGL